MRISNLWINKLLAHLCCSHPDAKIHNFTFYISLLVFLMNFFFSWSGVRDTWRTGYPKPRRLFWRRFHHLCPRFVLSSYIISLFGIIHFACMCSIEHSQFNFSSLFQPS
jgi:hypothetical protein